MTSLTRLWWAMVRRDLSSRWGALANAGAAVERDRLAAAQRADAREALDRLLAMKAASAVDGRQHTTRAS